MKHDLKTTLTLLLLFVIAQLVGLLITSQYITVTPEGNVQYSELPLGIERPQMSPSASLIYVVLGVLIGTAILFILIKFKAILLWKFWYGLALLITLTISFKAFVTEYIAFGISLVLTLLRIKKPSLVTNHIVEIFLYGGIAAIFVNLFDFWTIFALLIIISIYDMIAVWKSKHMIKLAKFQAGSKMFAGFSLNPKGTNVLNDKINHKKIPKGSKKRYAILGGGDVAFPLLFISTFMKLQILNGIAKQVAFLHSTVIVLTTTLALFLLFYFADEKKFYPAMPFLSLGCFAGYVVTLIL